MGKFLSARPLEKKYGWTVKEITATFDTILHRKFQQLRQKQAVRDKDTQYLAEASFLWSQEREEFFNLVLGVDRKRGEFIKRANIEQLNEQLRDKISRAFEKRGFGMLNRHNGFFVYHPKGNKTILILPRVGLSHMAYFLIDGLALRSVPLDNILRLVRVHTYTPEGVFMEEKILEKEEYQKAVTTLIEQLSVTLA